MHAQIETPAFAGVSLAGHKPDSVEGDHPSRPPVSRRLEQRTRLLGGPPDDGACSPCTGRGLASRRVTTALVGSYPTFSPLPSASPERYVRGWRSPFCATFRRLSPPGVSPASCPLVSGLSSDRPFPGRARGHP